MKTISSSFALVVRSIIGATLAALTIVPVSPARAVETNVLVRDPSTIIKRGNTYWVYGTGKGTQQFSSTDRIHWTKEGPALAKAPAWLAKTVPGNDNVVWAPDVHFFNNRYYLYSSWSQWGSNNSGIGVATNTSLDPKGWVDGGLVIASANGGDVNAIDPCIFQDAQGQPWLSYGSYVSGIKMIPLDLQTGLRKGTEIYSLATHPAGPGAQIEASCVYFHDGYYYLFVNWDGCCQGAKSSYNIRMGRSKTVTGPYLDRSGKEMMKGGGTLFLAAIFDNGSGRPIDDETGPGHVGILPDTDGFWLSTHYEWARDKNGATTMNIQKLAWDKDGWPRAIFDRGPYQMATNIATHNVATVVPKLAPAASILQTLPDKASKNQRWNLEYQGDGFYSILSAADNRALGVIGDSKVPGAKVELSPFARRDGQLWQVQRNDDGTYTLLTKPSEGRIALDVSDCSPNDATPIQTWTGNNLDCQKWTLRLR